MSGRTTAGSIQECSLADRILLTLHLADRREYSMSLAHIPKMLIYGEAEEEKVRVMLSSMPSVSHKDGIYCLKGSECLLSETRRRLLCNGVIGERYEAEALLFSKEYASLCPFIVRQDAYMAYELLRQKPIFGIDFYRKILAKNMWLKTYFPQIYYRDSCETNVRKTLTARILHPIYTNYVVSKLGERMCKGTSTFLGSLYSSHTGITSKPSLYEVGD